MEKIENVKFFQLNFLEEKTENIIFEYFNEKVDIILSDMASDTTSNKS